MHMWLVADVEQYQFKTTLYKAKCAYNSLEKLVKNTELIQWTRGWA